jgi:TfoX/Sxy family transcriptional regulator of competence genes
MPSDKGFAEYVLDLIGHAAEIEIKKMFGEYGVYGNGKFFALICDNQLFVKPTKAGKEFIGDPEFGSPYPNAKPHFLITERLEDREWMKKLIHLSLEELPYQKSKK